MARYDIIEAPSKRTLRVAYFSKTDSKELDGRRTVIFFVETPNGQLKLKVVINFLKWEGNSGETWCFEGCISNHLRGSVISADWSTKVNGWFRTSDRKGYIDVVMRQ